MILIAASFSLLVIVAGMFLLAKTQKDNLSNFFKYVSYFVIIVGFLNLFGGGACMLGRMCMNHCARQMKMENCQNEKHCKHHKMKMCKHMSCEEGMMNEEKCMMMMGGEGKCSMEKEECMKKEGEEGMMGGKSCCKDKMKKDSIVIIKK